MASPDTMRIAFVSAVFAPQYGGMSTVATHEAHALAAHHEVTVFTLHTPDPHEQACDRASAFRVVRLRGFPRISFGGFTPQLLWYLWSYDVVYLHAPAYGMHECLLLWFFLKRHARLVVTTHMDPIGTGWRRIALRILRPLYVRVVQCATAVRVSSEQICDTPLIRSRVTHGKKVHVIPFGVDLDRFTPRAEHPSYILFVGRLGGTHYFKGLALLIEALQEVVRTHSHAHLVIVGDGSARQYFENLVRARGLTQHIQFVGAVHDDELPRWYRGAHALVLPSTDTSETFGLVLLEALACGTPVIASRLPGVASVVTESVGTLIRPGDRADLVAAIQSVYTEDSVWHARRHAARARAEEFGSWDSVVHKLTDLLYASRVLY